MKKWLLNPFEFIAGPQSLLIGITAICLTAPISYLARVHYDGAIDIHIGAVTPLWFYFASQIIGWLSVSVVLYIAGKIFSSLPSLSLRR